MDQIVSACLQWLERAGDTRWLLIFDNVDDLETFRISNFFPKGSHGSVIATSQRPECSRLGEGWRVKIMDVPEGVSLLSKSYGRTVKEDDEGTASHPWPLCRRFRTLIAHLDYQEARRVMETFGCLPLAIDQVGSYLFMLPKPLRAFSPWFEEQR